MLSRTPIVFVACALAAACECGGGRTPERSAQIERTGPGEAARPVLPPPEGTPVDPEVLRPFAPEQIAGFASQQPVQTRATPLPNGGKLPGVRRSYRRDGLTLQVDITDSLHAATVRELVLSQQGQQRKTERSEFEGTAVAGYPALVQWHAPTRTGIVNMVVGDRFMVNVKASDADGIEPALAVAKALPLSALAELAAQPDPADAARPKAERGEVAQPARGSEAAEASKAAEPAQPAQPAEALAE